MKYVYGVLDDLSIEKVGIIYTDEKICYLEKYSKYYDTQIIRIGRTSKSINFSEREAILVKLIELENKVDELYTEWTKLNKAIDILNEMVTK